VFLVSSKGPGGQISPESKTLISLPPGSLSRAWWEGIIFGKEFKAILFIVGTYVSHINIIPQRIVCLDYALTFY
jgi:hypothetical protein